MNQPGRKVKFAPKPPKNSEDLISATAEKDKNADLISATKDSVDKISQMKFAPKPPPIPATTEKDGDLIPATTEKDGDLISTATAVKVVSELDGDGEKKRKTEHSPESSEKKRKNNADGAPKPPTCGLCGLVELHHANVLVSTRNDTFKLRVGDIIYDNVDRDTVIVEDVYHTLDAISKVKHICKQITEITNKEVVSVDLEFVCD